MGESSGAVDDLMKLVGSSEIPRPMAEASRGHQILELITRKKPTKKTLVAESRL